MADRERFVFYMDPGPAAEFREAIRQVHGKVDQNKSEAARSAVREWTDAVLGDSTDENETAFSEEDRELLQELHTHLCENENTHTQESKKPVLNDIADEINAHPGRMKDAELNAAIIDCAQLDVGDDRTLTKYKDRLREMRLAYRDPQYETWTTDQEDWISSINAELADHEIDELLSKYKMSWTEYDELVDEYVKDDDDEDGGKDEVKSEADDDFDRVLRGTAAVADGGGEDGD